VPAVQIFKLLCEAWRCWEAMAIFSGFRLCVRWAAYSAVAVAYGS